MSDSSDTDAMSRSKVARVIEEYGLGGLGRELEEKWTQTEDRWSLRELATEFNQRVLGAVLREAGRSVTQHEVEHVYSLLTGDDVSEGARTQKRRELERDGIEVDSVLGDFVTHQAIHTYLRNYRGVTLDTGQSDPIGNARETLERLRNRTVAVTEETVERLDSTDRINAGEVEVYVEIRVRCETCGTEQDVASFLDGGGCDCPETQSP